MQIDLFRKYRIYFRKPISINRLEKRNGVCSQNLETGKHILLWDFDESELSAIAKELHRIQCKYALPTIYILQSSEGHYHAYCFCARLFREVIHILSDTVGIDIMYLRLGMARGYYTLRFSEKGGKKIHRVSSIMSKYPDEMSPEDVTINEYLTTNI